MPISFPANPTLNQTYTYNNVTWTYNGNIWSKPGSGTVSSGGGATVTVSNSAPSSASVGQLWIDSDYGDLNAYFSGAWVTLSGAQGIIQPTIATVSGSVRNLWTSNLTIIGNNFGLNSVTVRFSFGTVSDVTVLPSTNTQITVQVPSSIYNLAVGTIGTISVIDSFGRQSNGVQKTIEIVYDGTTSARAAASASAIYNLGVTTNGLYWILIGGTARQIWCDMVNGGWMLAAKINTPSATTWQYSASYWTDTTVLNATSAPTDNVDIKTYAWFAAITQARMCMGSVTNFVTENHSSWTQPDGTGLNGVFSVSRLDRNDNANTLRNSVITRANWITLFNGAGIGTYTNSGSGVSWDNCNYGGVNVGANSGSNYCRFGIHFNNESNCDSCDYHIGFGWAGSGGTNSPGNAGVVTRDNYNGSSYRTQNPVGWIFVK